MQLSPWVVPMNEQGEFCVRRTALLSMVYSDGFNKIESVINELPLHHELKVAYMRAQYQAQLDLVNLQQEVEEEEIRLMTAEEVEELHLEELERQYSEMQFGLYAIESDAIDCELALSYNVH